MGPLAPPSSTTPKLNTSVRGLEAFLARLFCPAVKNRILEAKLAKKLAKFPSPGAKSRDSGGAPPTHLILLRNQRRRLRARVPSEVAVVLRWSTVAPDPGGSRGSSPIYGRLEGESEGLESLREGLAHLRS